MGSGDEVTRVGDDGDERRAKVEDCDCESREEERREREA